MAQPTYYPQQQPMAEVQSIKSMLHIGRIVALIFGIIWLLAGIAYIAWVAYLASVCSSFVGVDAYCGGVIAFYLIFPAFVLIWGIVDFLIWVNVKAIESMVDARQYEAAKSKTLIWVIVGFIFGGIIVGIFMLLAYLKFDPVINASRAQAGGMMPPPGYGAPPPQMAPPPPAPAPMAATSPPPAPICPMCGQPGTYVAQYGRYYCYTDKQYL
ncbi:MAG TPA: hypothetical protein VMF04_00845 [Thermoplasmata archaeon]|nr:hypothetical protein [Thermoplasmata archaeon]